MSNPAKMHEGYADLPDARPWYWDTGGDGPPLVLCHPASQGCGVWENQRDIFAAAGYRVIAYSRRGHHPTDTGPADHPGTTVDDLAHLLTWLKIERAFILGAAAGGITALGFTCRFPDQVLGLVLAGTIFAPNEDDWRAMHARLDIASVRGVASTEFLELGPAYRASNPEGVAKFAALSELAITGKGTFTQPTGATVTWKSLENLGIPVLLLTGEADLFSPPPMQHLVAQHLAHHELVTLPATGHAPYWEAPDLFNAAVLGFLENP
ncbi:MAG: alpha/beta hydrolase [Alphaproteobacteria bacterium]|nr:alpha/beta hydrolase [Alphaproteobacteria bacterium]